MKRYLRESPFQSYIKERELITKDSSTRKTYHIVLDTKDWEESYKVGDSIGIIPANDVGEVNRILKEIGSSGEELVLDIRTKDKLSIRDFLTHRANLARVNRSFLSTFEANPFFSTLLEEENKSQLSQHLQTHTMAELLTNTPIPPQEIAAKAMPLLPRFYSIANSVKVFPQELHLLVSYVQYHCNGQLRLGVGSHFLCDMAEVGKTPIPIYVQPSNHFTIPTDGSTSIIMVGPGTGIAPYRSFLQDRLASQASGRNWLFFGERNQNSDFYYEPFWCELEKQ